ncbi:MAG: DNA-formamidopyrimidine glycosylase family protein [Acidimicrobiales bacterium]
MPQMQALAERLHAALAGAVLERADLLGFASLKTAEPAPNVLGGQRVARVGRRGKYVLVSFDGGFRVAVHLSQGGRVDIEDPPKSTRPRGALVRFTFCDLQASRLEAILVREHGTQRKAGWWVLAPGDEGPLATLGPEADSETFAGLLRHDRSPRRLYTWLRDQHVVAGIGRGYTDDALHRAQLSPFATVRSLEADARERLLAAIRTVLAEGLEAERGRRGGLSEPRLGGHFSIHGRAGEPCPRCGAVLRRVSFDSYEVAYCTCQTGGTVLADRRLSRLLR